MVITGLGVVAPNGIGKDAFWHNLVAGYSAVDTIRAFDPSPYPSQIAAEVRDFEPERFVNPRRARHMWRFSQFAVASALMAVRDAQVEIDRRTADRIGVSAGTSVNGLGTAEGLHTQFLERGLARVPPSVILECPPQAPASHISIELGIMGPTHTISSNCCTGLDVVYDAYTQIVTRRCDVIVAAACEAPIFPFSYATFSTLGLLSTRNSDPKRASRPYDLLRDGLVLGEGGGAIVVEELESALRRRAPIYAEISGYASSSEAIDMRNVDRSGDTLARTIERALHQAGLDPSAIDYINSHGSSLPDYDICDVNAFKAVFGPRVYNIPISSIKSMLGQAVSVSGMFQVISSCLSIQTSIAPPTINQQVPDPQCDLDFVANQARTCRINCALTNAHGIGGSLSAMILRRPELN